ncbi:unnamed protein product [Didymodactylos carnosus]|uniref:Kinesin light chain n=1 Tax=Didymodactylos carnosus TaxID=1234261 RepID=A0A8S2HF03_9BILA|nr:unnamed protein product [Didymodactylos carnosus]CAF3634851.1 unnamed protein product [Didymodactylos carnosus]
MPETDQVEEVAREYTESKKKEMKRSSPTLVFGDLLIDIGEYSKALTYFTRLLDDPKDGDLVSIYCAIGRASSRRGEYKESLNNCDRARDYDQALKYQLRALEMKQISLSPSHDNIARSLTNIDVVYHAKGDYGQALDYYMKALKMQEISLPRNHASTANTLMNISLVYHEKGDYDQVLDYYMKALVIQESSKRNAVAAELQYRTGACYVEKGSYDLALLHFNECLKIYEEYCDDSNIAMMHVKIAQLGGQIQDYDLGVEYFAKALVLLEKLNMKDVASLHNGSG